ncbi:dual specificity protein phosphatase family protein [Pseudaminobacter salicylatoxidans]|uniref:dual specificity protein phosphatase family protein n=1 Tax=Pseudaminobacter salicylatoxidans TaxID=93369 RepID=UPI0002D93A63|nr:dual specificity protein phosphatase family protein [Pseudaminobacter salicylatoxidans]
MKKGGVRYKLAWRALSVMSGAAAIAVGLFLASLQWFGNFHTVVAGELYRSAQVTPDELSAYVANYGIRTVINLRGDGGATKWYVEEKDASSQLGIEHVDFSMSAQKPLSRSKTEELAEILRSAPKPILIHCKAGSDRSGFASALYLAAVKGVDVEEAENQLSVRYGHISLPFMPASAMDETYEDVEAWLGYPDS